jgi:putative FmdB family regulatory protein
VPTYEYVCDACRHAFEEFQQMSEAPLRKCPKCGKRKLKRLFGIGSGIIFKGSGFYETDYKRKSGGADSGSGSGSGSGDAKDGAPSGKGAEKPAESTSGKPADSAKPASPRHGKGAVGKGKGGGKGR